MFNRKDLSSLVEATKTRLAAKHEHSDELHQLEIQQIKDRRRREEEEHQLRLKYYNALVSVLEVGFSPILNRPEEGGVSN